MPPVAGNDSNSQSSSNALTPNSAPVFILQDKKTKNNESSVSVVKEDKSVNILSDNALLPATGPVGVVDDPESLDASADQVSVYVVRKGDSIAQIADMFKVSVSTILSANDMKKGDKLTEGDVLIILPISGLEIKVAKGQTLKSIAKLYKVDVSDITQFNGISEDAPLAVGESLFIPDGDMLSQEGDKPVQNLAAAVEKDKNYYITHPIKNLVGYFINPLPTGRKTQGLHDKGRAVDIGAPKGTPIYAAASGIVTFAKTGTNSRYSNGGFGGLVIMSHPNGTQTYYAHQSKIAVSVGQRVTQGKIIGYVGSTGRSTGPHLHFEVRGARNPGADWSWAKNSVDSSDDLASAAQ